MEAFTVQRKPQFEVRSVRFYIAPTEREAYRFLRMPRLIIVFDQIRYGGVFFNLISGTGT